MKLFPIQSQRGAKPHPTQIPWDIADLAYSVYSARYGREQSLEKLAERHGFGPGEMDELLPGWREMCAARNNLQRFINEVRTNVGFWVMDPDPENGGWKYMKAIQAAITELDSKGESVK